MFYNPTTGDTYSDMYAALTNMCKNVHGGTCKTCPFDKIVPHGEDCRTYYKDMLLNGEFVDPVMIAEHTGFVLLSCNDEFEVSGEDIIALLGGVL